MRVSSNYASRNASIRAFLIQMANVQVAEVHRLHDANRTLLDVVLDEATQEAGEPDG